MTYLIFTPKAQKENIFISSIGRAYFVFLAAAFISVIFAQERIAALDSFRSLWVALSFFLAANWIKSKKQLDLCLVFLIIVASFASLVGIIEYMGGLTIFGTQIIPHKWRATGLYGGSMTFAGLTLVMLMASIPVFFPKKVKPKDIYWLVPLALLFLGVLLSRQRGAWLGFTGGIIFIGIIRGKKTLFLIILALAIGLGITYKFQPKIWERITNIFKIDTDPRYSIGNRLLLWQATLEITREHPLVGTGFDQFKTYAEEKILPKIKISILKVSLCHAHSNLFQIMATTGLIGFLAYIYLWIIVFREGFRALRRAPPSQYFFHLGVLSALVAFHIEGFFEYTFGDSEIITIVWFLLGGMVAMDKINCREQGTQSIE